VLTATIIPLQHH